MCKCSKCGKMFLEDFSVCSDCGGLLEKVYSVILGGNMFSEISREEYKKRSKEILDSLSKLELCKEGLTFDVFGHYKGYSEVVMNVSLLKDYDYELRDKILFSLETHSNVKIKGLYHNIVEGNTHDECWQDAFITFDEGEYADGFSGWYDRPKCWYSGPMTKDALKLMHPFSTIVCNVKGYTVYLKVTSRKI